MRNCVVRGLATAVLLGGSAALVGCSGSDDAPGDAGGEDPGAPAASSHHLGALHQHTSYSDGHPTAIPADMFRQSRERGLAFNAATEHSDFLFLPVVPIFECLLPEDPNLLECLGSRLEEPGRMALLKWRQTQEQARGESSENFVGIRGFEWTNPRHGHINVYFSRHYVSAFIDGGIITMNAFWNWFTRPTSLLGGADALLSFNHPGREDTFADFDPGYTWNDVEFVPEVAPRAFGMEVFNRGSRRNFDEFYVRALDNGWHLAPIGSEDHHEVDWGALYLAKTSIITDDLSEEGLHDAMLQRRVYALLDNNAQSLADFACLTWRADDEEMGSVLVRAPEDNVRLRGTAFLRDGEGQCTQQPYDGRMEIVTTGELLGRVVAEGNALEGTLTHRVRAGDEQVGPHDQAWYILRLRNRDDEVVAYSAPVWIGETRAPREGLLAP